MSKLLYVESSPRKDRSVSSTVARSFIEAFEESHHDGQVRILNLWDYDLPEFTGDHINAKYNVLHGENPSAEELRAWEEITRIVDDFKNADNYLFSIPMWNFSIPYKLKQYIDVITQPGLTFSYSPETGYKGLIVGKPATVIYASGGEYSNPGSIRMDFQKLYMETYLKFIGFEDIKTITIEPTLSPPEVRERVVQLAQEQARTIAHPLLM
ncbi:MAG: NAD(P)H-dependent oxidoreductase [Pirellulales bacterium]|nr:NAD(P)H-dependent oxidoreductase [Pirellulales bacterium]